jgi:hypothetical protein
MEQGLVAKYLDLHCVIGNEIIFGSRYKHNDNATPIGMHNAFMNSFTLFGL